jgi:putative endonuclease
MSYTVYILKSEKTTRFYCGQTQNLSERIQRHNSGRNKSTKAGIPWKLIWITEFESREEAVRLESKIKKRGINRFLEQQ